MGMGIWNEVWWLFGITAGKEKQKIFIPLTIDKRFWNKDMPNVFLNRVYEAQIEKEDKDIQYTILQTSYTYAKDERFQDFCVRLIGALGEILNQYHGLNESNRFWRAMLWLWVQEYATSMKFKIEQFNNLRKMYSPKQYTYCSYAKKLENPYQFLLRDDVLYLVDDEEYHFATYSWMADSIFNFRIEEKEVQNEEKEQKNVTPSIYEILRNAFHRTIKIVISILNASCPSRARIGLYHTGGGWRQVIKWFLQSHGAIQEISIPIEQKDYEIDDLFRKSLPQILKEKMNAGEEDHIILAFLPYIFPTVFIEKFEKQYNVASDYLRKHKNMVVTFTLTSMLESSTGKICELLLQKRGGKIIGQQHGGNYQVTPLVAMNFREREWNDIFYYWGKGALSYQIDEFPDCKISYGPSYKFYRGNSFLISRDWIKLKNKIISKGCGRTKKFLFVGTAVEAYTRHYTYGKIDEEKKEYVQRKFQFLSYLNKKSRAMMVVREYPKDYGWHLLKKIQTEFPDLRISIHEQFSEMLSECALYISDHWETTWLEAIYFEKPTVFLLPEEKTTIFQGFQFRKEEKEFVEMLEEIGIIVHSPEKAAELVNYLAEYGVMEWWMDEKRQRVMEIVRERWTTKIKDEEIDNWWYHELMEQAEKVKRDNGFSRI